MLEPERILKLNAELPYCINKEKGPSYHISQGLELHTMQHAVQGS